jgi:L-ribulose-5-phosphate 3-epimerase
MLTRRDFVRQAAIASAAVPAMAQAPDPKPVGSRETAHPLPVRVGMTDWNLGRRGDITKIALAREIGLDGIQVSVQYPTDGQTPTLRDPGTQADFKRAALENGIQICSLAIGNPGKSRLPMHTNPAFAILLVEAVEVAHNLGTNNILLPILGDSHIDMTNQSQVAWFVAMMKEVARYAERHGVVVSLEDWISAEDNIRLLDAIGSDHVAVYYDAHNIARRVTGHLRGAEDAREPHPSDPRQERRHADVRPKEAGWTGPVWRRNSTPSAIAAGTSSKRARRRATSSPTPAPTSHT